MSALDAVRAALDAHRDTICGETLCVGLRLVPEAAGTTADLNGQPCVIVLKRNAV